MILMARISLILLITWQILVPSTQEEREVLIRDRLVMVLCDQIHDYINSGSFPQPVKQMPEKYTHIKPGSVGSINGFQIISSNSRRKRENEHPILDFIF